MGSTLRRSFKRRVRSEEPNFDFQEGLVRFQANTRKRESMRVKRSPEGRDREEELHKEIQAEERLSLGTARLLTAAGEPLQRLQAAKSLLLSTARQEALRAQLIRLRRRAAHCDGIQGVDTARLGEASLSDIRIPLRWSPEAVINDVGDRRQFAIFAVVSCGTQVYDTALAYPVDCQTTDLVFSDVILMSNVRPDFQLKLELYSYCLSVTSHSTSKSLFHAIRAKLQMKKHQEPLVTSFPDFLHTAAVVLTIGDAGNNDKCHQLTVTQQLSSSSQRVPQLFGQFSCRLAVKPYIAETPLHTGRLSLAWPGSDIVLTDCEARLLNWRLAIWPSAAQLCAGSQPWHEESLTSQSHLDAAPERLTFSIRHPLSKNDELAEFTCSSLDEYEKWTSAINSSIQVFDLWQQAAGGQMEIFSPSRSAALPARRNNIQKTKSRLLLMYHRISAVNIAPF